MLQLRPWLPPGGRAAQGGVRGAGASPSVGFFIAASALFGNESNGGRLGSTFWGWNMWGANLIDYSISVVCLCGH
jgi:hypothetical protein